MTTIDAIQDALGTRVEMIAAVRATQEWGGPFNVSDNASVAVVEYAGNVYDSVMDGQGDAVNFLITMLVPKGRIGESKLKAFCDPTRGSATSVREKVNGTLGGIVAFATVVSNSGFRDYTVSEGETYLGCEFTVSVGT